MSQSRIHLHLAAPEASRIYVMLEDLFEEDGYALSYFEVDQDNPDTTDWTIDIYVPDEDAETALGRAKDQLGSDGLGVELTLEKLGDEDWIAMSLEGLKPVSAGRFFVHGAHDTDKIPAGAVNIEIEAGQAFGTGHHGTTAGCLEALEFLLRQRSFERIFDLGTGTGLLAIGLAKALRQPVLASDIDAISVDVARENADLNGVGAWVHVVEATGVRHAKIRHNGPFDLIVANILAGPLIAMAGDIAGELTSGGSLVLSGILEQQTNRVVAAYVANGLRLERQALRDGWSTLTFRAPN